MVLIAVLVNGLLACGRPPSTNFQYMRVVVDGQSTLGVSRDDIPTRGVVIFFHAPNADEFAITSDEPHKRLTEDLVNAGFAVVSSQASGNAFGDAVSQRNYRELANMALEHYRVENVFLLAESMGAVAALNLLAIPGSSESVRGLALINPVLDLSNPPAAYETMIRQSYTDIAPLDRANPMNLLPERLAGKRIRIYIDPADTIVGAGPSSNAFERRFGSTAEVSVVDCKGASNETSCFHGSDLLKWFSSLEHRVEQ